MNAQPQDIAHPQELIGSRAIIQGASGAGKTYAIRRILEATHGRMQHIVFDVEDELFTLRERFDYVLIGGDGADAPLSEATAGELAITLLELGVSAILQLNDLGLAGYERGWKEGEAAGRAAADTRYQSEIAGIAEVVQRLQDLRGGTDKTVRLLDPFHLSNGGGSDQAAHPRPLPTIEEDARLLADALISEMRPARKAASKGPTSPTVPTAGAMQLLGTAVTHWPVRFTWSQLAALNGRKARGGHFNSCKKLLVDGGFVIERDGRIEPSDAAFERIGVTPKKMPRTRAQILDLCLTALPSPAKDILREVAARPGPAAIEDVAGSLGLAPRGGHWNAGVSMLRINDLVRRSPAGFELGCALGDAA